MYFDSPCKDVSNDEPKSATNDERDIVDGLHNESDEKDKSEDDSSSKEDNAVGQHVNTASPEVNTGRFKLNTVDPLVNTASLYDPHSPKDMFKLGDSHSLEATQVEFFSDEDELEVDLENIPNSYPTRRMTKPTSKQGFLSAVYEEKSHDTLNTYLLTKGFDAGRLSILSAWYEVEVLFEGCLMMSIYSQEWMLDHSGGPPVKVGDEAVHKELGDGMERATTTASSLEA
ncbi:hypothetical protein Tco_1551253, partial [Tanacetum coccineum]